MRLLIFSQYYAPEITAARARVQAFAEGLAALGHEVTVVCEVPNHPEGIVQPGFKNRIVVKRESSGVSVSHVWVYASPTKSSLRRLAFYGSYAAMAMVVGSFMPKPDAVLVSSPPLPAAAAAAMVAKRFRVPWVFDVRDIWPEAAVILGELTNPRLIRAAEALERWLYRDADAVVTVTDAFRDHISSNGATPEKIHRISNGTTRAWLEAGRGAQARRRKADEPFVWTYAGNVGIAQGIEHAIEAARQLGPGFRLRIVGHGPMLDAVKKLAGDLAVDVEFTGLVEPAQARQYMLDSDALLVPLANQRSLAQFIPSKLFDCCAVGRPVVVSAPEGEATRLVDAAGAGLCAAPGSPEALVESLRQLASSPDAAEQMGRRGMELAAENLREDGVARLAGLIEDLGSAS
jgi:glycosyltransferase involved in cell wall biosynthesis